MTSDCVRSIGRSDVNIVYDIHSNDEARIMDYKKLAGEAREACGCTACKIGVSEPLIRPTSCLAPRILEQMRFDIRLDHYETHTEIEMCSLKDEDDADEEADVSSRLTCSLEGHDWNGGICYRCKEVYRPKCKDDAHDWDGYTCTKCDFVWKARQDISG